MRPWRVHIALCGLLTLAACRPQTPDLERLIELHTEARGGRQRLESVDGLRVDLHLVEPGFEADIVYRARRPGWARVDVTIDGEGVFTEAIHDAGAWQQAAGAPAEASSPEGADGLRRSAVRNLYSLHELAGLGYGLELLDDAEIDGTLYYVIAVTAPDGHAEHLYLDSETYLVRRQRVTHALHPDVDSTERRLENRRSDFRTVDGIVRSFRSEDWDLDSGERVQAIDVRTIEVNPPMDGSIFEMPAATVEEPAT